MSLLKGNYKLKKSVSGAKKSAEEEIETELQKEALKRLGGSMVYVSKKSVNWDLKPKDKKKK